MRYPKFLPQGGTIGYVAPSFGCNIEPYKTAFNHSLEVMHDLGFQTKLGPNVYEGSGLGISNSPEKCGQELNEAYQDADSDVLISCGGGELMCQVIPYMDFEAMKQAEPKWFMGFSDNTNFTFMSATIMDTAAIYGPCAAAFGQEPWHASLQDALDLLQGKTLCSHNYEKWEREGFKDQDHPLVPYNVTEPTIIRRFNCPESGEVKFSGRLLGGCLDSLSNFLGTEFDHVEEFNERYKEDGIIWFLEACDLNPMSIRRSIWQMVHAGWFSYVKGFLIGRPLCYGAEDFGLNHYHAFTDLLEDYGVPIIMDLDIGHLPPMMPLICGSTADVTVTEGIRIDYTFK